MRPGAPNTQSDAAAAREGALAEADKFVERVLQRRKGAYVSDSTEDLAAIRQERLEALGG
jgi:hypothetical protein